MPIPLGILAVAGAGAGDSGLAYDLLETTNLSVDTTSITFSSLNTYSEYKHLQIRAVTKGASNFTMESLAMRVNGSSASSQRSHKLRSKGGSVISAAYSLTEYVLNENIGSATGLTNQFSCSIIDILDFASTSKNKTIRAIGGGHTSTNTAEAAISLASGLVNTTSAITSIEFFNQGGGQLTANTRISIYGIK